ncbi:MAG: 50S ribosomal protein L11 methyltransferase [Rhodospirillaceae bacterium]
MSAIGSAWSAKVTVRTEHAEGFEQAFAGLAGVVSMYEAHPDGHTWTVEGTFDAAPPRAALIERIALAASSLCVPEPTLEINKVPAKDWLSESVAAFPPLRAGRFYIHGDHIQGPFPPGAIRILVNAATAFGSGHHASTLGCLLALDDLSHRRGNVRRGLDMGAGTAILAIGMAKAWRAPVVAADIDPVAVKVSRYNAARNGVAPLVHAVLSEGCGQRDVTRRGPYDVITANILARPLAAMSADLANLLAPGGTLILAGFLRHHEQMVLAPYRMHGLRLVKRFRLAPWTTLVLGR